MHVILLVLHILSCQLFQIQSQQQRKDVQDTEEFCRQTLCDPSFVRYVNSTFLCWGGDIRKSDPFTVCLTAADGLMRCLTVWVCPAWSICSVTT